MKTLRLIIALIYLSYFGLSCTSNSNKNGIKKNQIEDSLKGDSVKNQGKETNTSGLKLDTTNLFEKFQTAVGYYDPSKKPVQVDLSKNLGDTLSFYIEMLWKNQSLLKDTSKIIKNVDIILLKLYLGHLKCCDQSYDVLSMRTGAAKDILDYFFKFYKIDFTKNHEGMTSGISYIILRKYPEKDDTITNLMKSISKQEQLIDNGGPFK
jgi:hypothetical protein